MVVLHDQAIGGTTVWATEARSLRQRVSVREAGTKKKREGESVQGMGRRFGPGPFLGRTPLVYKERTGDRLPECTHKRGK